MNEWSLDVLYKGYYDEAFVNDFKKMDTVIQRCTQAAEQLCHDNEVKALHDMLSLLEEFHTLADRVGHFISLKQSTNTSDGKTVSLMNQFSQKFSGITKA
ncbi:TPA: peptidase M3, partial [Clostridioides difficile]